MKSKCVNICIFKVHKMLFSSVEMFATVKGGLMFKNIYIFLRLLVFYKLLKDKGMFYSFLDSPIGSTIVPYTLVCVS